ncbi:unnamed protein product [Schistosoma curassoni]|uniref:Endo/exonuclease/phosphatase domain-containing protein n=1 Tax=Schistosoma curassoni TaxID=6186 RepID=A0A183JH54_9TREM|nr:unnamed protein product [Schistosoma curassoni]
MTSISLVNAAKTCFGKRGQDTSKSTRSVDTQIAVKQTQVSLKTTDSHSSKEEKQSSKSPVLTEISRKDVSSVPRLLNGIQQETPRSRSRKARSVSGGKHNLASQIFDNPPESHGMFDATAVASPSDVDEWVHVVRKKQHNDIKGNPAPASTENDAKATLGEARSHLNRLRICYTNARSLLNKRSELGVKVDSTKPEIIAVTEIRLMQSIDSMGLDFEGFTLVRAGIIQKRKGGGVALLIRNAILFAIIDSVSHESGTGELLSCRLKCKGQELLIGLVYRSSSCEVNEVLLSSLDTSSQSVLCLILGDFNAPMVDLENPRTEESDNSSTK